MIAAVNLGHDADTEGVVARQLAGALYGIGAIPQRWLQKLIKLEKFFLNLMCSRHGVHEQHLMNI